MGYKQHTNCRVCGNDDLKLYLDLGMMPLSNNLCEQGEEAKRYPLKVLLCEKCGLSQLSIVVFPETLFSNYSYRSGISAGYRAHCRQMCKDLGVQAGDFVIDIAGNDGTLLHEFQQLTGCNGLNVDPAMNLVPINEAAGVRQFTAFWGKEAADHLKRTDWPKARFVIGTNVFAHVDDVKEFLTAAASVLTDDGRIVLEFPYLIDFIENNEFDTVYFEHLSYFSVRPLAKLCYQIGLIIQHVKHIPIHGGSIRVEIGRVGVVNSGSFIHGEIESGYGELQTYLNWSSRVQSIIQGFRNGILELKRQGVRIAGFAASAKGNTLLNTAGITSKEIDILIDETPEKWGKYSPGTGIPICNPTEWGVEMWNTFHYMVILSWNFKDEIIAKVRAAGYTGKFILPLTFEII